MKFSFCFLVVVAFFLSFPVMADTKPSGVYDRVMASKTIRCGYINYPPHFMVDPKTGKKSGITYEIMEEVGRLLELKVEWVEELTYATTVTAIQSGRVDAICTSFWQNPVEGKFLGFTMPMFYSAVGAYVRADDNRFTGHLENIDTPKVKISALDGSESFYVAKQNYPKASVVSLPNTTDESQMLAEVQTNKADITFIETYVGEMFNKNNGHKLKNITLNEPVRLFGNTIAIPNDDPRFQNMLNSALVQLVYGGFVEKTIRKYEEVSGGIYRVARPYEALK